MSFEEIISQYGYLALFIGTFLEGETILLVAGFLAHNGQLDLWTCIIVAFCGTYMGDQLFFYIGYFKGIQFLERRPKLRERCRRVFELLHHHQIFVCVSFRFFYGLRNVTPFVIGSSGLHPLRFLLLNGIGASVWAISFGHAGYFFGNIVEDFHHYQTLIFSGIVILVLVVWLIYNLRRKMGKVVRGDLGVKSLNSNSSSSS